MTNTLTLQLPETIYTLIIRCAQQIGQTPEQIAAQWIIKAAQAESDDPLLQLSGIFASETTEILQ